MWAINFGGAAAGVSKELLDLGQCFSSLLLSLHQFFFFFFWFPEIKLYLRHQAIILKEVSQAQVMSLFP